MKMTRKTRTIITCSIFAYLSFWFGLAVFISPQFFDWFLIAHVLLGLIVTILIPMFVVCILRPLSVLIRWTIGYKHPWMCWWIDPYDFEWWGGEFWNSEMNELDDYE